MASILQALAWTDKDAFFLSGFLNEQELNQLAILVGQERYFLYQIIDQGEHIASFVTRYDTPWDGERRLDVCHVGGHFTPHLSAIDDFVDILARQEECKEIRVFCGRKELAMRLVLKHDCRVIETIVAREVL